MMPPHGMETAPSPEAPLANSAPEIEEPGLGVEAHYPLRRLSK